MTTKIPIRTVYDDQNDPVGLAEFQVGEYLGVDYGGTGSNTIAGAKATLGVDASNIRSLFTVTGGGEYNNTTGVINISATDLTPYAKTVDLTTANVAELTNLYYTNARVYANVVNAGFYNTVSNTAPIGASENGTTLSITHLNSGVSAATYGGASQVPVLTINETGHITSAANVSVAGVSNFAFSGNTFTISTADGGSFSASITSGVDLVSPDLLGTPLAPTAAAGTNTTQVATTAFVRTEITNLIDSAPTALDTLNELAAALGDDANFATTTATSIGVARNQANAAYDRANVGVTVATSAFDKANTLVATVAGVTSTSISNTQLLAGILAVDGSGSGLDADTLDGQNGSYYLDWTNTTNKPDPVITVSLTGDVTGSAAGTLVDLASNTISIATTIAANSVALGTDTTGDYVGTITAGTGISSTGATSGEGIAHTISLATAGAGAASYTSGISAITVDAYGRVTSVTGSAGYSLTPLNRTISQISSSTTAVAGNTYAYTANVTITLPASPSAGDTVGIINMTTLKTAVVNRNTKPIMGLAEDFIIDTANAAFELVYTDATYGWRLV